jgi:hypothetical protein
MAPRYSLSNSAILLVVCRPADVLQDALAQQIGTARAGFRKLDDLVRYRLLDVVAAALDLQGDADAKATPRTRMLSGSNCSPLR